MKAYVHKNSCTQMFTTPFILKSLKLETPRCPPTGEWINCGISIQEAATQHNEEWTINKMQHEFQNNYAKEARQ